MMNGVVLIVEKKMKNEKFEEIEKEWTEFKFAGLVLGTASGWDGDQEILTFYDLRPSLAFTVAFPLTAKYEEISCIHFLVDKGIMQITNDIGEVELEQNFTIKGI